MLSSDEELPHEDVDGVQDEVYTNVCPLRCTAYPYICSAYGFRKLQGACTDDSIPRFADCTLCYRSSFAIYRASRTLHASRSLVTPAYL